MSTPTKRPLSRRIQQRVFRVLNVPMRALLGLPFATPLSVRRMLVFLTGRKTGKRYRQPVSYVRDGAVLLTPGGGNWKLNLADGRPERIRLRGKDVLARPEIVSDAGEIERLLAVITAANPDGRPVRRHPQRTRWAARPRQARRRRQVRIPDHPLAPRRNGNARRALIAGNPQRSDPRRVRSGVLPALPEGRRYPPLAGRRQTRAPPGPLPGRGPGGPAMTNALRCGGVG
jgi:hypothetical protein